MYADESSFETSWSSSDHWARQTICWIMHHIWVQGEHQQSRIKTLIVVFSVTHTTRSVKAELLSNAQLVTKQINGDYELRDLVTVKCLKN